ncbi:MAG: hypothetical protein ACTS43_01775 [Candidatus Hodgkinia cicadicola]
MASHSGHGCKIRWERCKLVCCLNLKGKSQWLRGKFLTKVMLMFDGRNHWYKTLRKLKDVSAVVKTSEGKLIRELVWSPKACYELRRARKV